MSTVTLRAAFGVHLASALTTIVLVMWLVAWEEAGVLSNGEGVLSEFIELFVDDVKDDEHANPPQFAGAVFAAGNDDAIYVYDVSGEEDILTYDRTADFARQEIISNFIPAFNSGRGDLASEPFACVPTSAAVAGLTLDKFAGDTMLEFHWIDGEAADEYAVFEDGSPSGDFLIETGSSTSGTVGVTVPMPVGTWFFLVKGRTAECGLGF